MLICSEIRRAFHSIEFRIAICIGTCLMIVQYFQAVYPMLKYIDSNVSIGMFPHSVFNKWAGANFGGGSFVPELYFMILSLLATLPFGASFYQDINNGYARQLILLTSRKEYLFAKYLSVFISGGMAVTAPLILNLLMTAATLPSIKPVIVLGYFPWQQPTRFLPYLVYENPYIYTFIYLGIIFLFSGGMACLALPITHLASNKFIVTIAPFLFVRFEGTIVAFFQADRWDPQVFLNPIQYLDRLSWGHLMLCFFILMIPTLFVYVFINHNHDYF